MYLRWLEERSRYMNIYINLSANELTAAYVSVLI